MPVTISCRNLRFSSITEVKLRRAGLILAWEYLALLTQFVRWWPLVAVYVCDVKISRVQFSSAQTVNWMIKRTGWVWLMRRVAEFESVTLPKINVRKRIPKQAWELLLPVTMTNFDHRKKYNSRSSRLGEMWGWDKSEEYKSEHQIHYN